MASSDEPMDESFTKCLMNYLMSLKQTVRKTDKTKLRDRKKCGLVCTRVSCAFHRNYVYG